MWRIRAAVLTLVGAVAVHEGRYLLAPPQHGHEAARAHAYVPWLIAVAAALALLIAAHLVAAAVRRRGEHVRLPGFGLLWSAFSFALTSVFVAQEAIELALSHGQVPGLLELLLDGAWVALPLAVACGGLIALLLRGAAAVVEWALRRAPSRARRGIPAARRPLAAVLAPRRSVLARRLAGRAPPPQVLTPGR